MFEAGVVGRIQLDQSDGESLGNGVGFVGDGGDDLGAGKLELVVHSRSRPGTVSYPPGTSAAAADSPKIVGVRVLIQDSVLAVGGNDRHFQ